MAQAQRRALDSLASMLPGEVDDGWVTVGEAAEKSGLATATIRQLYRSGAIASRRRNGSSGPYLVPLEAVLAQVPEPSEEADAAYWEDEARRARAECAALRAELERVRAERDQLQREVEHLREPVYRGFVRDRLPRPPVARLPEIGDEPEPDEAVEAWFAAEPEPAVAAPAPSAEDTVVPAEDEPRRGLFRRRRG